jgi:hypothetical protein
LEKNKEVFLVGGGAYFIDDHGKIIGENIPITGFVNIKNVLKKRNCFWHFTIMFKNEKNNFYREKFRYTQDYDFITLFVSKGKKIDNLSQILAKYRIHKSSTSYSKRTKQDMFAKKVSQFYAQRLETGTDDYDSFDEKQILDFDIEKTADRKILLNEIKARWITKDYAGVRRFTGRYIKNHGIFNKQTIYFIASHMPKDVIILSRNIWNIFRRKNG